MNPVISRTACERPEPKCYCGRKAYLVDPMFPCRSEQNRCWYHRGGTKWFGREKEYQREYRRDNRDKINANNRSNPNTRKRADAYRKTHRQQFRDYNRKHRMLHHEAIKAKRIANYKKKPYNVSWWKEYRKRNAEKLKTKNRAYLKKQRERLSDTYIRRVLAAGTHIPAVEIPAETVELSRAIIKLKRILWENQKT